MRRSFFLHLALGLLSWSSQALGSSAEPFEVRIPSSKHQPYPPASPQALALASARRAASAADADS